MKATRKGWAPATLPSAQGAPPGSVSTKSGAGEPRSTIFDCAAMSEPPEANLVRARARATGTSLAPRPGRGSSMMPTSPALTADCVVFDGEGRLLLIRRRNEPYAGRYALPGGFVEAGERVEAAALRELKEETGVAGEIERLIGVYSDPERDPRGHTVSVA